jgi:hypothetical protein
MDNLLLYLIKVSSGTFVFYMCYFLFFRTDTFYRRNRIYLLMSLTLPFIIPLVKIFNFSAGIAGIEPVKKVNDIIISGAMAETAITEKIASANLNNLIVWLYFSIAVILLIRVIISVTRAYSIIRKGTLHDTAFPKVILSEMGYPPFSFFPFVVIPRSKFESSDYPEILKHENAHVSQGHTFDLILSEVLIAILWFNPFMWLIKRSIVLNHEYLADNYSLTNSGSKKEYQYKLLNIPKGMMLVPLAHNYSSLIKKRIIMLNRKPTAVYAATKNMIILPLVATLFVMCSLKTGKMGTEKGFAKQLFTDLIGSSDDEKLITIGDYRYSEIPKPDLSIHRKGDLEINRIGNFPLPGYTVTTFQLAYNKLVANTDFLIQSPLECDEASYRWENDSTLKIKMINSSHTLTERYTIINYGGDKRTSVSLISEKTK